jgi:hypothetical protein
MRRRQPQAHRSIVTNTHAAYFMTLQISLNGQRKATLLNTYPALLEVFFRHPGGAFF